MDGIDVIPLAEQYGTPLIVISENRIRNNIRMLVNAVSSNFENYEIKYAVKANPNPSILSIVKEEGLGIDASSMNEATLAIKLGFKPENILFTPNFAARDELLWASNTGLSINFDSVGQLTQVSGNVPESVSFRIKIDYGKGEFKGTTTSGHNAKFGILEKEAVDAYKMAKKFGARKFGIHVMAGSNVMDPDHFRKVTESVLTVMNNISEHAGIEFDFVDLGGGLGVPYEPDEQPLDLKKVFEIIHTSFKKILGDRPFPRLCIEPGRYVVADSSILIGKVTDVKIQEKKFLGSDISMNTLIRPALYGARHHIVLANKLDNQIKGKYEVVGQICENTDRIGKAVPLPNPEVGDIIAVFDAGAYVASMASNYNGRPIPAEVLISDSGEEIIRSPSTFSDYVRNYIFIGSEKTGLNAGKSS
ncbi:MAG: diaminopimelate decarboxylase [Candidatus Thermoplasmatota archaeon]|nr:diaminopimelate decarboxylase [Candidatus Thermoplasmatota archaeon]